MIDQAGGTNAIADGGQRGEGGDVGRTADSPMEVPARGWRQVALRAWDRSWRNNIGLVAAGTAFYGFLAIVPILIACVLIYSLITDPMDVVRNTRWLATIMPERGAREVGRQLLRIVHASNQAKGLGFVGSLGIALFGARNAATALIAALNIAYGEKEQRSFGKLSAVALAITASGFAIAFAMLILLSLIGAARAYLPGAQGVGGVVLQVAAALAATALGAAGAAALYRFAPCREKAKWKWITPGSIFAAIAWLVLTFGFTLYVSRFGRFSATYGPSAAGIVLLVWLYLSTIVFLFGAEINAELEQQTVKDTTA